MSIAESKENQVPNLLALAFGQALKGAREFKNGTAKEIATEFNC